MKNKRSIAATLFVSMMFAMTLPISASDFVPITEPEEIASKILSDLEKDLENDKALALERMLADIKDEYAAAANREENVYNAAYSVSAYSLTSGDYEYTENEDGKTITITRYIGDGGAVEIPETIDGYTVTIIGDTAFDGCTELTAITIPDSVTVIGSYAFNGCSGLTGELTIPDSVTTIGGGLLKTAAD